MTAHILIEAETQEIIAAIQRDLILHKIDNKKISSDHAVKFGAKIGPVEISSKEFIEVILAGPEMIGALFATVQRFRCNLHLLIGGKSRPVESKETVTAAIESERLKHPAIFKKMFGRTK